MRPRRFPALLVIAAFALISSCSGATSDTVSGAAPSHSTPEPSGSTKTPATKPAANVPATTTTAPAGPPNTTPSDQRKLTKVTTITEAHLTPKSVVASQAGLFFAQNMIYSHTINVYDRTYALVKSIPDSVTLADWGFDGHPGVSKGGPVELAVNPDGTKAYATNYQMYGSGFDNPGDDKCAKKTWDHSYAYRIDTKTLAIDQVIEVGSVPKYIAVTPDGAHVLVTNWCGYDMTIIDAKTGKATMSIPLGRFPRGIAVTPDSRTAFVAVMGSKDIAVVDLTTHAVEWIKGVGSGPRHLVIDHDATFLYATLNGDGKVAKIDIATRTVVSRVASPSQPRSMTISADGRSLYVVNYDSDAMSKIRTSDMAQLQRVPTGHHPIGITYDNATGQVWVACYSGSLYVFDDQ